jgi:hypothetical protein
MGFVQTPADARLPHPGMEARQDGRIEAKTAEQGRGFTESQNLGARRSVRENSLSRSKKQRMTGCSPVRDWSAKDQGMRCFVLRPRKDAANGVGIHLDIWGADQDVARTQVSVFLEKIEQSIMKDLDLAQWRVTRYESCRERSSGGAHS